MEKKLIPHSRISSVRRQTFLALISYLNIFFFYLNNSGQSSVHPEWNFYKYLIGPDGHVIKAWSTKTSIDDIFDEIKKAVDAVPLKAAEDVVSIAKEPVSEPESEPEAASHDKDEL